MDFEVLSAIKYNEISSIMDLADKMHKYVKTIQPKVHKLSEKGFIQLIDGK